MAFTELLPTPSQSLPVVKICGIRSADDAGFVLDHTDADYLGIICVPNRQRTIEPATAKAITELVHSNGAKRLVGVFRNQSVQEVRDIAHEYNLDIVQLHGDEHWEEYMNQIHKPIIKRVIFPRDCADVISMNERWKTHGDIFPLFDSEAGGTGEKLDWEAISYWASKTSKELGYEIKFLLAGGLTPENVAQATSLFGVSGVDVSGGVENEQGFKSHDKLLSFVSRAKGK